MHIYYNEKKIVLSPQKQDNISVLHSVLEDSNYVDFISEFLNNPALDTVQIYGKDEVLLLKKLKKQFKYIEAAGGLVLNSSNEFLLINRLGYTDLPKGKIEKGEDPKAAALREVEEECSISGMDITKELPPSFHIYVHNERLVLKKTYWFLMQYSGNETPKPQTEENIESALFAPVTDSEKYKEKTYASLKYLFDFI